MMEDAATPFEVTEKPSFQKGRKWKVIGDHVVIMPLTNEQLVLKTLRTLFYVSLLWTASYQGFYLLKSVLDVDNGDGIFNFAIRSLKILCVLFLYSASLVLMVALLVCEYVEKDRLDLAEETDEELRNMGRYAIHERKLLSGFLKETGTQTYPAISTNVSATTVVPSNQAYQSFSSNSDEDNNDTIDMDNTAAYNVGLVSRVETTTKFPTFDPEYSLRHNFPNRKAVSLPGFSFKITNSGKLFPYDKFVIQPESSNVTFEDLGGIDKLKQIIHECVLTPLASASKGFVDVPCAILLIGAQGSGKSSIFQGVVNHLRSLIGNEMKCYRIEGPDCFGPFISAGITFHDLFYDAIETSPFAVILLDHIDKLYDDSIPIFLSELSSIPRGKILVIATARNRERLDNRLVQIRDPGKFDYIFEIELPDFWERVEILKILFRKKHCPIEEQDILQLADTNELNAGELEKLVTSINVKAVEKYKDSATSTIHLNHYIDQKTDTNTSSPTGANEVTGNHKITVSERFNRNRLTNANFYNDRGQKTNVVTGMKPSRHVSISSSTSMIDQFRFFESDSEEAMLTRVANWVTNKNDDKQ